MLGSPRRCHLRWEEDIRGQFRVTVPDAGELDQLRTRWGYIGEVCMPSGTEIMYPLSEPGLCLDPLVSLLQSLWIRMMHDLLPKKFIDEYDNKLG